MIKNKIVQSKFRKHVRQYKNVEYCVLIMIEKISYRKITYGLYNVYLGIKTYTTSWLGLYNTRTAPLQRSKSPIPMSVMGLDTTPSDGEAPVLERWEMWSIPSSSLLPGPLT